MKLFLQITDSPDSTRPFEHAGATLRIGRDPAGDVSFAGSDQVSWQHARIDLAARGASLTDLDSTNGTFVNDRRIQGRVPLQPGDQVQLGLTGPVLRVIRVELPAEPAPAAAPAAEPPTEKRKAPPPLPAAIPAAVAPRMAGPPQPSAATRVLLAEVQRTQRTMILAVCAIAAILVALVAVIWWNSRPGRTPVAQTGTGATPADQQAAMGTPSATPAVNVPPAPADTGTGQTGKAAAAANLSPALAATEAMTAERKDIGRYVTPEKEPPSVLLKRQLSPYPWGRLKPLNPVATGDFLVSLPGYRSRVYFDSGVHLTLWGNLPEFSAFPPVLESTVMLHVPPPGIDLDFTLDHGRVHLFNYKGNAPATVRVHFQREVWDLTLPNSSTEVVLELWGLYPRDVPFSKNPGGKGPLACLGVFTQGEATLKAGGREIRLPNQSRLTWTNTNPTPAGPESLPEKPKWWTESIDKTSPEVGDVALALKDYSELLNKTDAVVDALLTQIRESKDDASRRVGVLCLGGLDATLPLVDCLEERRFLEVRGSAAFALRHWMARNADQDLELYRLFIEKKGYSIQKAEILMRLLHSFSDREVNDPVTYQTLIGYLDHENLPIRELAFWHLANLVPEGTKIPYKPDDDEAKRKEAVAQWQKLVPPGKVPPRPSKPPGIG